jgi:G:T-mismatch repair DNA endonuclease (very short patch repair protein)
VDNKVKRECPVCGVVYHANPTRLKHGRQTTCSRACSYQLRAAKLQQGEEYECPVCGERFYRAPAEVKARHGNTCCSRECAYQVRQRVVSKPYNITAEWDRSAASEKGWHTRRREAKPYPDAARKKARARAIQQIEKGRRVSKFERKAAQVFRHLGFRVVPSLAFRRSDGTFACVFDIYLPGRRLVVECHGGYWHGGRWTWDEPDATQAKNLRYERRKHALARERGLDLRLLWEKEFKQDPTGACLAVVR